MAGLWTVASLQVRSDRLTRDEITAALSLDPTQSRATTRDPAWNLKSDLPDDSPLNDHLDRMLEVVETRSTQFESLGEDVDVSVFVGIGAEGERAGWGVELDHDIMERFGRLGINLSFDLYLTP